MAEQETINRRGFLKALALTAATASTVGGGAAVLLRKSQDAPAVITPVKASVPTTADVAVSTVSPAAAAPTAASSDALARLASAQADNLRLRAELDAALRRLEALEQANGNALQTNEALQVELASAAERVSLLAGLVGLYEQLDEVDLSNTVTNGLQTCGETFGRIMDEIPGLEAGVNLGLNALEELDAEIPTVQSGRSWVENHVARLEQFYQSTETVLSRAVDTAGPFIQMLNEWFQSVRKWLPFGVGDKAAGIMAALSDLVNETPNTIQGLRRNVGDPLDAWIEGEGEDVPLRRRLIKPVREQALNTAGTVAAGVRETHTTYETELVAPVQTAAEQRRVIREQIAAYREEHAV